MTNVQSGNAGNYTVVATNSAGSATSTAAILTVTAASAAPTITSTTTATATAGVGFSYVVAATNSPTSYSATGLPAGLSINTDTGVISGTATVSGTFTVSLTATNGSGTGSPFVLTITVAAAGTPMIISGNPAGVVNSEFSYWVTSSVPREPNETVTYTASNLPAGLEIEARDGYIFGTPTQSGSPTVTLTVTNTVTEVSATADRTFTVLSSIPAPSVVEESVSIPAGGAKYWKKDWSANPSNGNLTWLSADRPRYYGFMFRHPPDNAANSKGSVELTIVPTKAGDVYRFRLDFGKDSNAANNTYVGRLTVTEFPVIGTADPTLPNNISPTALRVDPVHWAINNPATTFADGSTFDLKPKLVWDSGYAGSNDITVLVMDTGVQKNHPALARANRTFHKSFVLETDENGITINEDGLPYPQYLYPSSDARYVSGPVSPTEAEHVLMLTEAHGTKVAGAVAGLYLNSGHLFDKTVIGMAPGVRILAAKVAKGVMGGSEGALDLTVDAVTDAIDWGIQEGARISVSSFRLGFAPGSLDDRLEDTRGSELLKSVWRTPYVISAQNAGMLHFVAAGNDDYSNGLPYPAGFRSVIAIGAVNAQGTRAIGRDEWNNILWGSNRGSGMGFVAPGYAIVTAEPTWLPRKPGSAYAEKSLGFTEDPQQSWSFLAGVCVGSTEYYGNYMTGAPTGAVSAPVVDGGGGGGASHPEWSGKIVLINYLNLASEFDYFYKITDKVVAAGGVGLILSNSISGRIFRDGAGNPIIPYAGNGSTLATIPGLTLSLEDGNTLRTTLASQAPVGTFFRSFQWNANRPNSGTSFAAPYAAGVAALVLSRNPSWTATMVEEWLQKTAKRMPPTPVAPGLPAWPAGYDQAYGFGMIRAFEAANSGILSLVDLSTRGQVSNVAGRELVMGFVVGGTQTKRVLIRAVGPKLGDLGDSSIIGGLSTPTLTLHRQGNSVPIGTNTGWKTAASPATIQGTSNEDAIRQASADVGTFPLSENVTGGGDSALHLDLSAGQYTATITGGDGLALAEVYDAAGATALDTRLVNLSTRGYVGTGQNILTSKFVVEGNSPRMVLVRAIGPSLEKYGVTGVLANPYVRLLKWNTTTRVFDEVATNDNWGTSDDAGAIRGFSRAVGAFTIPDDSLDAVILKSLTNGMYSVEVYGVGLTTGVALVEVYPAVDKD
jgi:subtilisin family serine protease